MNLHMKIGLGIKNYFWDPNSDVENQNLITDFSQQKAKKSKNQIFPESVKTGELVSRPF